MIKGTSIGAVTDIGGRYSLAIPARGGELVFSYIGYLSKTLPINNSNINVVMEEDLQQLDEVVVVGYGTVSKSSELPVQASEIRIRGSNTSDNRAIPVPVTQVENTTSVEFEIKTPYTIPSENKVTVKNSIIKSK